MSLRIIQPARPRESAPVHRGGTGAGSPFEARRELGIPGALYGTYTFTDVATDASSSVSQNHGLNTDNIIVVMEIKGATNNNVAGSSHGPNAGDVSRQFSNTVYGEEYTPPVPFSWSTSSAAGTFVISVTNGHSSAQDIYVRYIVFAVG